ncbi:hypothetical protein BBJ29_007741 [Phytophthora kernoviae]|uniref:Major facilitator superfamily (MFS) profile domain-containing protein n=1 Tax=Phytophthora kernoviae TaxID=325452 RepID=A0A3F2RG24_9STRA|nr:hypothetical protein BBP00_00008239 [Phytophthora kernoviae]RLN70111.1 hypothetical protein BBJ29_007741 [Phytophthora kernoviae]
MADNYTETVSPKLITAFDDANKAAARLIKPKMFLFISAFVSWLQAFQSGWSTSQMNLAQCNDTDECNARPVADNTCLMFPGHSKLEWTFAVNAWIVGAMISCLGCGHFSDKFGRKKILMSNCIFMLAGGVVQSAVSNIWLFALGRLIADPDISDPRIGTLIIEFINVWPAIFTGAMCSRFGARNMIIWGLSGMFVMAVLMTVAFVVDVPALSILFTALHVAMFGATVGPLCWVMTAEVSPDSIRASASSLCIDIK